MCLAREMNRHYAEVMQNRLLIIDDVGREEPYQEYGNRFNVFPDFVDDCERRGKFLIANTNCTKEQLADKYGERTLFQIEGNYPAGGVCRRGFAAWINTGLAQI